MQEVDVVIFGAGIAGASLAWRLSAPPGGLRVMLVEREAQPGLHSTGRSAAMFMTSYGPPGVRALTRASRAFYEHPTAGFSDVPLLRPRGALYVATLGQEALLEAMQAELAATCPRLQRLDAATARARVACLRPERLLGALYDPEGHDMDVDALLQGFLKGLRRHGGELRCGAALERAAHDGTRWQLHFANAPALAAPIVVNATGAWADDFAARFGAAPIGLEPRRRSAFTFRAPDGMDVADWPLVIGVDESWYFKPDAGQLIGSPANADPVPPHDVQPEELDIATGIHHITSVTTLDIRRPTSTWAGLRSFVADGDIVIGFDAGCPGFFWLAAQGGYGIQSAAGASALADALIRGAPLANDLLLEGVEPSGLSPSRLR